MLLTQSGLLQFFMGSVQFRDDTQTKTYTVGVNYPGTIDDGFYISRGGNHGAYPYFRMGYDGKFGFAANYSGSTIDKSAIHIGDSALSGGLRMSIGPDSGTTSMIRSFGDLIIRNTCLLYTSDAADD